MIRTGGPHFRIDPKTAKITMAGFAAMAIVASGLVFSFSLFRVRGASAAPGSEASASAAASAYRLIAMPPNADQFDPLVADAAKAPFFPSRASTGGRKLAPSAFDDPSLCSACHADIYRQWERSVMAHSWDDPVYRSLLDLASRSTGGKTDNFCVGCHSPVGLVTGEAVSSAGAFSDKDMSAVSKRGVHCDVCHSISGATGLGNGSYVLAPRLVGDRLKFGPYRDAVSPGHHTAFSELHTKSELCAACHNVTHPFNRMPVERTYDEWRDSPYCAKGIQCQDCHMTPAPGKASPLGKDRKEVFAHGFVGGNAPLLETLGLPEQASLSRELLRTAATVEFLDAPAAVRTGRSAHVQVRVTNVGAGHKLPSGFPEGREVWVDFTVADAAGREVYRLGAVLDGETEPGTKSFKVVLGDAKGNPVHVKAWEADRILSDNRIPPGGRADLDYSFPVPAGTPGPLVLHARLNYWPYSPAFLAELMGAKAPETSPTEMAAAQTTISVAAAAPRRR